MFTDTHCHLYQEYYNSIDEILRNAAKKNVNRYIVNGINHETNIEVLKLTNDNLFKVIGIHPEEVANYKDSDIDFIKEHINDQNVIAIGEIGLDYHYEGFNKDLQKDIFCKQLKLASELNKPVVIHSRDATEDTIKILKEYKLKGVIHSFSGSYETALIYIKMGYVFGINGVITFKNAKIKDVIKEVGLENIVLETDAPYLTPSPHRGERNEPAYIHDIAEFIANLFDISIEEVAKITNTNIKRIFDI